MVAAAVPFAWGDHGVGVARVFDNMTTVELVWTLIGFGGQALFASRFIIQWFRSEQVGRSVIPLAFWYCSIGGGIVLFSYALYRQDPVFIAGQGVGLFVYGRNLYLIFREKRNGLANKAAASLDLSAGPQSAMDVVARQSALVAATRQPRTAPTVAKSFAKSDHQGQSGAAAAREKAQNQASV